MIPDRDISIPQAAQDIMSLLAEAGFESFVVGGFLRNTFLGCPAFDVDLATSASPEEVIQTLDNYSVIPTGLRHGTVNVVTDDGHIEVTTFREDSTYSDHRHPDEVRFTKTIEEDLARRDFTINALAWNKQRGLVDPWGGQADLSAHIIRAVGDPDKRFFEDALRIFRGMRLSSELGFSIDNTTSDAMHKHKNLLREVAPERLQVELNRLLVGDNAVPVLREFADIMAVIIPELSTLANKHFIESKTNERSSTTLIDVAIARISFLSEDVALRLAALLLDLGYVQDMVLESEHRKDLFESESCSKVLGLDDSNEKDAMYPAERTSIEKDTNQSAERAFADKDANHSAEKASLVLQNLRYDRATIDRVRMLIRFQHESLEPNQRSVWGALREYGEKIFFQGMELRVANIRAIQLAGNEKECADGNLGEADLILQIARDMIRQGQLLDLADLAIDGHDLVKLGYQGEEIGKTLEALLEKICVEGLPNTREMLLELSKDKKPLI